ncbi:MAG: hypothetical protein ABH838_01375 [Actinomycetota bacterium]
MEEEKKKAGSTPRKVNVWIPIAVVGFIVALIAVMALMSGSQTGTTNNSTTAATGTTQSGGTTGGTTTEVDVSWITLETTPNQVSAETGIPAKMIQQFLGITEEQMDKSFKDIGGEEVMVNAQNLVVQFGGGSSSSGSSTGGSMMGGTSP